MKDLDDLHKQLIELDRQFVNDRDNIFHRMAKIVEAAISGVQESQQLVALRNAAKRVRDTGKCGFFTAESRSIGDGKLYQVVGVFHTIEEMQAFYSSLAGLTEVLTSDEAQP